MKIGDPLVYSRPEQRAIIVEALGIFPNVWVVYNYVGKRIGVSYGSIWNIARAEGIKHIRFDGRWLLQRAVPKIKTKRRNSPTNRNHEPQKKSIRPPKT
jgi:hypothetical protein